MSNSYFNLININISELGITLTIFGLSLVFLTTFIRNYYQEEIDKRMQKFYNKILNKFSNLKNIVQSHDLIIQQNGEQVMKDMSEVGKLFELGIEQVINNRIESAKDATKKDA